MSAAANLAGLYTPSGQDNWIKDLSWEPVPIHTQPQETDPYLAMAKPCPRHSKLVQELKLNHKRFKNVSTEYREEFEIMAKNTGWKNIVIDHFQDLYTTLFAYEMYNKSFIPAWANSFNKNKFTYLAGLSFASQAYTEKLKTLRAGPFFLKLLNFFDEAINNSKTQKFLMMSAHDDTVVAALETMRVYDFFPPEFAAMVIWEVRKDPNVGLYLKIYYKKPSKEVMDPLITSGCTQPCKYEDFSKFFRQYVVDDKTWEELCKIIN